MVMTLVFEIPENFIERLYDGLGVPCPRTKHPLPIIRFYAKNLPLPRLWEAPPEPFPILGTAGGSCVNETGRNNDVAACFARHFSADRLRTE
jgi:hypothetical protein